MLHSLLLMAAIGWTFASGGASAEVFSQNPYATMSIIGADAVTLGKADRGFAFAVRMVDPQGQPIEGLTVEFFNDYIICIPLDPHCVLPPGEVYGHFDGDQSGIKVLTGADGVATSSLYHGGTASGTYFVAAYVSVYGSARNMEILKTLPSSVGRFTITQFGADAVDAIPALGPSGAWMLTLAAMLAALRSLGMRRVRLGAARTMRQEAG